MNQDIIEKVAEAIYKRGGLQFIECEHIASIAIQAYTDGFIPDQDAQPQVSSETQNLRSALLQARSAIVKCALDTLWCDDSPAETVVDRIDAALSGDAPNLELFVSTNLLPCPFCGGTDLKSGGDDKIVGTWCLTCEAVGPNQYITGQDWNRRPSPSEPQPNTVDDGAILRNLHWDDATSKRSFSVLDPEPENDHSAIYLVCPNGLMVNTSCDPRPGLDAARTQWMADTLNAALSKPAQVGGEPVQTVDHPQEQWMPIETAPKDGTEVVVYAAPKHGLRGFVSICAYHEDAGWCVDELRDVTFWAPNLPIPTPPVTTGEE